MDISTALSPNLFTKEISSSGFSPDLEKSEEISAFWEDRMVS